MAFLESFCAIHLYLFESNMSDYVTCQGTGNVMVYIKLYSLDTQC